MNNQQLQRRLEALHAKRPRVLKIPNPRFKLDDLLPIYLKSTEFEPNKRPVITDLLNEPLWASMNSFVKEELVLPDMHQTVKNEHAQLRTEVNRMRDAETRHAKQLEQAHPRILFLETMAVNADTATNKSTEARVRKMHPILQVSLYQEKRKEQQNLL